jgi:hypothetical protein
MGASSKITQSGAFGNEFSYASPNQHLGWGNTPPNTPLSKDAGFPYLNFEHDPEPVLERDASVNSKAFQTGEREVGRTLDKALSFNNRSEGIDKQLAWMFGWESKTRQVIVLNVTNFVTATIGEEFTDGTDDYKFVRCYKSRTITNRILYWVVLEYNSVLPAAPVAPATLTLERLVGDDIVYSSVDLMYEHLYEISDDGRLFRPFSSAELTLLGNQATSDDIRTCMSSLAKKFPTYLMQFDNTKCYKFNFKWSPAKFTEVACNWLGYDQKRFKTTDPEYGDVDFDMPCPMVEANNIFAHNQTRVEFGLHSEMYDGDNYTFYPVTDMSIDVEVPLQKQQDTESGLYLTDPVLSGQIAITAEATITHSKDEQFMDWRDNRTQLAMRISSVNGAYSQELLIKKLTINKSGPDMGDVSAEPLMLSVALTCGTHPFEDWLSDDTNGNSEIMGSPLVLRVVNKNPYNEMTGRDLSGARRP